MNTKRVQISGYDENDLYVIIGTLQRLGYRRIENVPARIDTFVESALQSESILIYPKEDGGTFRCFTHQVKPELELVINLSKDNRITSNNLVRLVLGWLEGE